MEETQQELYRQVVLRPAAQGGWIARCYQQPMIDRDGTLVATGPSSVVWSALLDAAGNQVKLLHEDSAA